MACCKIPFRTWIAVMIFCTAYINYTTRANLSMSITAMVNLPQKNFTPECQRDASKQAFASEEDEDEEAAKNMVHFDWDELTQGHILGGYFYGYFSGMFFSGILAEWLGPFWTIFIATALSGGLNSFCVYAALLDYKFLIACRVLMGMAGATIYPSIFVLMARWAPPNEKSLFSIGLLGNSIGICVSWYAVAQISHIYGWPWGFHVISFQIIVYLIIFFIIVADYPDQSRWIGKDELDYILSCLGDSVTKSKAVPPYFKILKSHAFWAYTCGQFAEVWGFFLQLTGVPKFLHEVVGLSLTQAGIYSNMPQLSRLFSGAFFGWFGDYLIRTKKMTKRMVRKSFTIISLMLPGVFIASQWFNGCNFYGVLALLTLCLACNGANVATFAVNNQDLAPNFSGTLFSMALVVGSTTGFICPAVTGVMLSHHNGVKEWAIVFLVCGVVYVIGALIFMIFGETDIQPWNEKKADHHDPEVT